MVTERNKLNSLHEISETHTPNEEYENFATAHIKAAAAECIPTKPRAKCRVPWKLLELKKKRYNMKTVSLHNKRNTRNANI